MKKVLILAYDFPPYVSVGGLRPYNWYKYFREFGVDPVVITRHWENKYGNALDYITASSNKQTVREESPMGLILRTPYKQTWSNRKLEQKGENYLRSLRKMNTAIHEFGQFIKITGPKKELYKEARRYLKNTKVDAIIATGDPFVLFYYAKKLSTEFNIPWIADYRDPWSQNKDYQLNKLYYSWNKRLEKKIVSSASSAVTVSDFLKIKLNELFPDKFISVLPNGYDPEVIDEIAQLPQITSKLTISFVGTIYVWHPWKSFIQVLSNLLEENHEIEIQLNLYGINIPDEVESYIQTFPEKTQNSIQIFPKIPNKELLNRIASENVMLLFNYYSFMGTKIFDYLGTRRKIILCYGNDPKALELKQKYYTMDEIDGVSKQLQADLIQETNSGIVVQDESHLKEVLIDLVQEFKETKRISCNSVGIENYSRKIQVQQLAELIKSL